MLWFGWFGFNAGNELKVDSVMGLSFLNTQISAAFAAMTWMLAAWITNKKPKNIELLTGVLAGLVTVTPAAGYVSNSSAAIIGIISGIVCYSAVRFKNKHEWDDALDVWGVHGVGGFLGIVLLGILASKGVNPVGTDGLLFGNYMFFLKQLTAVVISSIHSFGITYLLLIVINKITPVKVTEEEEEKGLDESLHCEQAYS